MLGNVWLSEEMPDFPWDPFRYSYFDSEKVTEQTERIGQGK
jgi:hypothetical protein